MKNRIFQCLAMQSSPYFVWVNFLITIAQRNLEPLIGVHSDSESEQKSNDICQVEFGLTLMRDNYQIGLKKLSKLCNFLVTAKA